MFKSILAKVAAGLVAVALLPITYVAPANAATTEIPTITLNGTVSDQEQGFINSKSVTVSSTRETKVNYRLVPDYSKGSASGVIVTLFMPSLEYVDGAYKVVGRDQAPTPLGIKGKVSAGGGWTVLSDTTVSGGPIVMSYDGDIGAGVNPAFDILLSTYNDGTNGVYGSVPEGTSFGINGFVSYETFDRTEGTAWETPNQLDDESRITAISSNLTWDTQIESSLKEFETPTIPIWDRYQYADYIYSIKNTSENKASNIDGYSVTFDIDSTDSNVNGLIPYDVNRWVYNEDGTVTPNDDDKATSGKFIGVPDEGGILIYDITDWDGEAELTQPIPYTYSGSGMIMIDRENGDNKTGITPDNERKYFVSIPLSRQGFPNPPALFKVRAITNILFAGNANWSKTQVVEREIVEPLFDASYAHTTQKKDVVFGTETFNELSSMKSKANAPAFKPEIRYSADPDFLVDRVEYAIDESDLDNFENATISYKFKANEKDADFTERKIEYTTSVDEKTGKTILAFDISELATAFEWDNQLTMTTVAKLMPDQTIPASIRVYGEPNKVGKIVSSADLVLVEKVASNTDYSKPTTYTEIEHKYNSRVEFNSVYPKEVIPSIQFKINGKLDKNTVKFGERAQFDAIFGTNDSSAETSSTTIELNTAQKEILSDVELTVKKEIFEQAENVRISYKDETGKKHVVDLGEMNDDVVVTIPEHITHFLVETDDMHTVTPQNFLSFTAKADAGLTKTHLVNGEISTYQGRPYDKTNTRKGVGTVTITLPNELKPVTKHTGIYGKLRTTGATNVGYESTFQTEVALTTGGINSPSYEHAIEMQKATKLGSLTFKQFSLTDEYLSNSDAVKIVATSATGEKKTFASTSFTADDLGFDKVSSIVIHGTNLKLDTETIIAHVEYVADIEIGASQTITSTFTGSQEAPFVDTKKATANNVITVRETQTGLQVEGVNQVAQKLGAGNAYDVKIYKWWGQGYTYNTKDYTLDQGYKSLGGFTGTLTRPTATYDNNNQKVESTISLPTDHFDAYYVKIRKEAQPFIEDVKLYRKVNGEDALWKTVSGSEWVENTQEGKDFWRINTARADNDGEALFDTDMDLNNPNHPYYKGAWDDEVIPDMPISKVTVTMNFTRESNEASPQMPGVNKDIFEVMGRFYASSETGKKATTLNSVDTFGESVKLTRFGNTSINSLVQYPFAQARTGANDNTTLANKVIPMGNTGEYLVGLSNKNTASWPYYGGHGADVYIPAATEYDEWLGMYDPAAFHDRMVYEFVYPNSPKDDKVYNFDAQHVKVSDPAVTKYLTGIKVTTKAGKTISHKFDHEFTGAVEIRYTHGEKSEVKKLSDTSYEVVLETGDYPSKIDLNFDEIAGFGDNTAEISGMKNDLLSGTGVAAIRVGGVVNGNTALKGTTNLYRVPNDTGKRTLMHTTSATLTGYTPKLGAALNMDFDNRTPYDYGVDGVTPNKNIASYGIENNSEADINTFTINVKPDAAFRSQKIQIPAVAFDQNWKVTSVALNQGAVKTAISTSDFVLNDETQMYEFDLLPLFVDGTLTTEKVKPKLDTSVELEKKHITQISIKFEAVNEDVSLFGSLSRADSEVDLPVKVTPDSKVIFVTGVWVDEDETGANWNSKPSFTLDNTKATENGYTYHSSFNVNGEVTTRATIFTNAGSGNSGQKPTLTKTGYSGRTVDAPSLFNRVAKFTTGYTALNNDYTTAVGSKTFYDAETDAQIDLNNIVVGDTTKMLVELRNSGALGTDNTGRGNIPIFNPVSHITVPQGLRITAIEQSDKHFIDGNHTPVTFETKKIDDKRTDLFFDGTTLDFGESVFYIVEFTATNNYGAGTYDTQNKVAIWNVNSRPAYTHHFQSYDNLPASENSDFDKDGIAENTSKLTQSSRFSNPNKTTINSKFDVENISGENMTIMVDNITNETMHSNTEMDLYLTLDKNNVGAFELTEIPEPTYPNGFVGEFDAPQVYAKNAIGMWVLLNDEANIDLATVNELKISYGKLPAATETGVAFKLPAFDVHGIGHWKTTAASNTKSYAIVSQLMVDYSHYDTSGELSAKYKFNTEDTKTVWKAIPDVELNVQSFDTLDEARAPYVANKTGKVNYTAGNEINYKITAYNKANRQGVATNTPYGKAPLLKPVIFDKIPEYLEHDLMRFVTNGKLDVQSALDAGMIEMRMFDAQGNPRAFELPEASVTAEKGLDVAGAQKFANNRQNDGHGYLSTAEPLNTVTNPANQIDFDVVTYNFNDEQIGRGERLEIVYSTHARSNDLPIATYADGTEVFAPMLGWYGSNNVTSKNANTTPMDMASLLHDVGISGDRGHEMTAEEFLSGSSSWVPGSNDSRRNMGSSSAVLDTFYDATADKSKTHPGFLNENATNDLYEVFKGAALEDNFRFATQARVNDGVIKHNERVLWAQDGIQLNRAWLYGASEMVPDVERGSHGASDANFYEHDKSLNSYNIVRNGYSPYVEDDYTYAMQLHEEFTVRLHATNMGDRSVNSGLEYTEILPPGITPYDNENNLLGVEAFDGTGAKIDSNVKILQTPENDKGYRAPAQSQEAGTYSQKTRDDMIPYVVRVEVAEPLQGMFNADVDTSLIKNQKVEIRVRVFEELPQSADGLSYWHDQFTLTTIKNEEYVGIYGNTYGAFDKTPNTYNRTRYPNDGMPQGMDLNDLAWSYNSYTSYLSFEPYGKYIRGLNAQGTATVSEGKPAIVTGDQIAMRKATLRVWNKTTKTSYDEGYDKSIQDFNIDPYSEFEINAITENIQLETTKEYQRTNSGYNYYSGDNLNDDIWKNAPQTIGGARGAWFEPTVTVALPYGVAPVLGDGSYGNYYRDIGDIQDVQFSAKINALSSGGATERADVSGDFGVQVELIEDELGKRYVMHFTANSTHNATVNYGESLVISPKVVAIDTPDFTDGADAHKYDEVITFANSKRPVFNPIVSAQYKTGSLPSVTAKDLGLTHPNNVKSLNGASISVNDKKRMDSISDLKANNMGALKITEPLIAATQPYSDDTKIVLNNAKTWEVNASAFTNKLASKKTEKLGAYGASVFNSRHASIYSKTAASTFATSAENNPAAVDAAGKYWYVTEVENKTTKNADPYEQFKTSGDVLHSKFLVTQYVTNFAEVTGETRIKLGDKVLTQAEYEELGFTLERVLPKNIAVSDTRNRIQWIVTPPANAVGTFGELASGDSFKLMYQVPLVDGYADNSLGEEDVWTAEELVVDSYVSLITDDTSLIGGAQKKEDFIVQNPKMMEYFAFESDENTDEDINDNGDMQSVYAHSLAEVQIIKPKAEVRINTTRPRIMYSNGMSGDTYFNSSDMIEYITTYAKNTGSGLKEMVLEQIIPTHESNDSSISLSGSEIYTNLAYVTTGKWEIPAETLERIEADGKQVDDIFKTYVYVSKDLAEEDFEQGGWNLLNKGGTSVFENKRFDIPTADRNEIKKVRIVVRALDADNYLVPTGTRMDVDADPDQDGKQEVVETDPKNHATESFPASVTDNAATIGLRASSDAKSTLFIYGTAQIWGNYVSDKFAKLAQNSTRSYLTPSRPVVNIKYDTLYYRSDGTKPADQRFGWSDVTTIAPKSSPHLKFRSEFINADKTMWSRDEDNIYAEDTLIDPFVSFQLPKVMAGGDNFTYVPSDKVDTANPLSDEHRSRYSLTEKDNNLWTWKIVHADGTEANENSTLKHTEIYGGPWDGIDKNVVSIWFKGVLYPGDKIVVEFINSVDSYAPGDNPDDLMSRALVTNNTGLLQPLNSRQNSSNKLGYSLDTHNFTKNGRTSDRLVFSEKTMFQYETYDNFGKRKVAYSDLNKAGTVAPDITPVAEGGKFSFDVTVDNAKEAYDRPYPYPIMYDVLPFVDDTSISNSGMKRNSKFSAWLDDESVKLVREGKDPKTYKTDEYTVFIGPFTKQDGKIVDAPMVSHADAASEAFYDSLGLPGVKSDVRDAHFVKLSEIKNDKELMKRAKTVLVMFNNADENLPGQNKLKLKYEMQAPLNAPAYLEQFNADAKASDYAIWNSFMATQRVSRFIPQESNNAGIYATQPKNKVYLGNYVWEDANYDGIKNEGTLTTDTNGREYLTPDADINFDGKIDDPGINGTTVTLLSKNGNYVDVSGRAIKQVGSDWVVIDDATGEIVLDEVFGNPIISTGKVTTKTQTDFYGNNGYYIFSNIAAGEYRVMFELPEKFNKFSATTTEMFGAGNEIFLPGEKTSVPAENNTDRLRVITEAKAITTESTDVERMSFDLGVAHQITVGGDVFETDAAKLDGYKHPNDKGIAGYHVRFKDSQGNVLRDHKGKEVVAITDAQGNYEITFLPVERSYYAVVTDKNDEFSTEDYRISPIIVNEDPFAEDNDNDGQTPKGEDIVKSNTMKFGLKGLYTSDFADRISVSFGFTKVENFGTIGNKVWNDENRNGIIDANESGVAGQQMQLQQYVFQNGKWSKGEYTDTTTTNKDGYYYFTKVPSVAYDEQSGTKVPLDTRYEVTVKSLPEGYTFTRVRAGNNENINSKFYINGTMHESEIVGDHLINLREETEHGGQAIDDLTVQLGITKHALGSLSGEIFHDTDNSGVKRENSAEVIYNAILQVKVADNWETARQDADGNMIEPRLATEDDTFIFERSVNAYNFENLHIVNHQTLAPYEYRVVVTQIPLWQDVSAPVKTETNGVDNEFKKTARDKMHTGASLLHILSPNQNGLIPVDTLDTHTVEDVDLGIIDLQQQAIIGDFIWYDLNKNGIQDAEEPGVPGVEVALNKVIDEKLVTVKTTTTDDAGHYEFMTDVADFDTTSAKFNQPIEYVVSFTLTSRQTITKNDVGDNANINSKFVNLMNKKRTDSLYDHSFVDPNHTVVSDKFDLVDTLDGFADYATSHNRTNIDGGVVSHQTLRAIGTTMFEDENQNGIQEIDEKGIAGLTVNLFKFDRDSGKFVAHDDANGRSSLETDANGDYEFIVETADFDKNSAHYRSENIYRVLVEAPAHMRLVEKNTPFDYSTENEVEGIKIAKKFSYVLSSPITLIDSDEDGTIITSAHDVLDADAGFNTYQTSVIIGGKFWNDVNNNGIQENGEEPITGHEVTLQENINGIYEPVADLNSEMIQLTDENGEYRFEVSPTHYDELGEKFLQSREYIVTAERLGYQKWSPVNATEDNKLDSDMHGSTDSQFAENKHLGFTNSFDIADSENGIIDVTSVRNDTQMDAGMTTYKNTVLIGGNVWEDSNLDGMYDEDELFTENQEVTLWKLVGENWEQVADLRENDTVKTDADGAYEFEVEPTSFDQNSVDYLKPYTYKVTIEREGFQTFSPADDTTDNSIVTSTDTQWAENIHTGISRTYVTSELDDNGLVEISSIENDTTDMLGLKTFGTEVIIGGTVWEDANRTSVREFDSAKIQDREVALWVLDSGEWVPATDLNGNSSVKTNEFGQYEFRVNAVKSYDRLSDDYLQPYNFRVTLERYGFEKWSQLHATDNTLIDSDVDTNLKDFPGITQSKNVGTMGEYSISELDENDNVMISTLTDDFTRDAGVQIFTPTVTIGGKMFEDVAGNGKFYSASPVFAGETVTLWEKIAGKWQIVEDANGNSTQKTDKNGEYTFAVEPMVFDPTADDFMEARTYRTTVENVAGFNPSANLVTMHTFKNMMVSQDAIVFDGDIDMENAVNDYTLDFAVEAVKIGNLPNTGGLGLNQLWWFSLLILPGVILLFMRKKKTA